MQPRKNHYRKQPGGGLGKVNSVLAPVLSLTFDSVDSPNNTPVGNIDDVDQWNTLIVFSGTPYTSVNVDLSNNKILLYGGSGITVNENAFFESKLTGILDTGSIVEALDYAFSDCNLLNTPVIMTELAIIRDSAFAVGNYPYVSTTPSYFLPKAVTIGRYAFYENYVCTSYYLPVAETIGASAFRNNELLASISLPKVTSIGNLCFSSCYILNTIYLPVVETFGDDTGYNNVFANISGLTISLTIPASLLTVNNDSPEGDINYLAANNYLFVNGSQYSGLLTLKYDSIDAPNNTQVADINDVSQWNAILVGAGTPYTSVTTDLLTNEIHLHGITSNITLLNFKTSNPDIHLLEFVDYRTIIYVSDYTFDRMSTMYNLVLPTVAYLGINGIGDDTMGGYCILTSISLPMLTGTGPFCFQGCSLVTNYYLPVLTDLGGTVGDDGCFNGISGLSIAMTVDSFLMICDAGNPDGDIVALSGSNTLTVNGSPYP